MSSGLLYLAIVGVWAGVLVPMWVRRSDSGDARAEHAEAPIAPRGYGRGRARVVARRRRRLVGIVLLFLATVVIAATGVAPWWIVPVPGAGLVGYLACLRAAAKYDIELRGREVERLARAEATVAAAEGATDSQQVHVDEMVDDTDEALAEAWRDPRVIDFRERASARGRDELFDQYADSPRRAVGD